MDLFERVELRRFVGREFLLWLWFESETFEATLDTKAHGSFGFWLANRLVLSAGKETTTIKGTAPGHHREAKEALLRGKLPELASFHLAWAEHEATFTLKADTMGIMGLRLPKKGADAAPGDSPGAVASLTSTVAPQRQRHTKRRGNTAEDVAAFASDEAHEKFYERMRFTRDVESIIETLYRDFLTLRLGPAWDSLIAPALVGWAKGEKRDANTYAQSRAKAIGAPPKRAPRTP